MKHGGFNSCCTRFAALYETCPYLVAVHLWAPLITSAGRYDITDKKMFSWQLFFCCPYQDSLFFFFFLLYCSCCATSDCIWSHFKLKTDTAWRIPSAVSEKKNKNKLKVMDSLVPLVELYGQTNDFILCDVERLHHFPRFQLTILGVEVPSPFHFIWETEMHHKPRLCQNKPENKSSMTVCCS